MKKVDIGQAACEVEMDWYLRGSVLRGNVTSGCTAVRTHFEVESNDDREAVIEVIKLAKQGCYMENMVQTAVPVESDVQLNGEILLIDVDRRDANGP